VEKAAQAAEWAERLTSLWLVVDTILGEALIPQMSWLGTLPHQGQGQLMRQTQHQP